MDTVLHDLWLGYFVEPEAQSTLARIEGDGIVLGCLRGGWVYRIAENLGPEVGHAVVIHTVETDIAQVRGSHADFLLCGSREYRCVPPSLMMSCRNAARTPWYAQLRRSLS